MGSGIPWYAIQESTLDAELPDLGGCEDGGMWAALGDGAVLSWGVPVVGRCCGGGVRICDWI